MKKSKLKNFLIFFLPVASCFAFLLGIFGIFGIFEALESLKAQEQQSISSVGEKNYPDHNSTVPRAEELELLAQLPLVPHEMRGAWLATVHNIDWPSTPGASTEQQQAELVELLERAKNLGLNTVLLQIRSVADAFYDSDIEPWSVYLTGYQGRAPDPYWDPLTFVIKKAHELGLELHAWLNPYRVGYVNQSRFDPSHIFRQRPDLVRRYGKAYWLDPGNPESEEYILSIVEDIATRYKGLDGIHYDDYFYPYPEGGEEFPDDVTQIVYAKGNSRAIWRRENINRLVEKTYKLIKRINPYLSFGISPFGIWRNNEPNGVRGLESYYELYADSRKWLQSGWLDYLAPQFYWTPNAPYQPYEKMLSWWLKQNTQSRDFVVGVNVTKLNAEGNVDFQDVSEKIRLRREYHAQGEIYYSLGKIKNKEWQQNIRSLYSYQALPSLIGPNRPPLPAPRIQIKLEVKVSVPKKDLEDPKPAWQLSWAMQSGQDPKYWVMYYLKEGIWNYRIYSGWVKGIKVQMTQGIDPRYFSIAAVDSGNAIGNISWFGSIPVEDITEKKVVLKN